MRNGRAMRIATRLKRVDDVDRGAKKCGMRTAKKENLWNDRGTPGSDYDFDKQMLDNFVYRSDINDQN